MEKAIKNFAEQFSFNPEIGNSEHFKSAESFVLAGMGGSHLAAGLIKIYNPSLDLYIHRDYGLPPLSHKKFEDSLFIASSYSGNTEETLDFVEKAFEKKYNIAVIAAGGKLIEFAKKNNLPYIQLPNTGIQPRSAVGLSLIAIATFLENKKLLSELHALKEKLNPLALKEQGGKLAETLNGKIPVIYSSRSNTSLAYNWKIKFNETAKIPAFYNVFSELNHNEMTGFDTIPSTKELSKNFHFIFLEDNDDHPQIKKRMAVCKKLYEDRGFGVANLSFVGATFWERILNSILLADWAALHLSSMYGTEPEQVPMVEEFKKLIS
jgi:glucose/mannose-6-phosphate isomerase